MVDDVQSGLLGEREAKRFPEVPLVLTGRLTKEDVYGFLWTVQKRHWWKYVAGGLAIGAFLIFLESIALSSAKFDPASAFRIHLTVLGIVPFLFFGWCLLIRWKISSFLSQKSDEYSPAETVVTGSGFTVRGKHTTVGYDWEAFSHSRLTDRLCLLFCEGARDPAMFFARSRFENDDDWKLFQEFLAKRLPERTSA